MGFNDAFSESRLHSVGWYGKDLEGSGRGLEGLGKTTKNLKSYAKIY
jgi:hypothetical protein